MSAKLGRTDRSPPKGPAGKNPYTGNQEFGREASGLEAKKRSASGGNPRPWVSSTGT